MHGQTWASSTVRTHLTDIQPSLHLCLYQGFFFNVPNWPHLMHSAEGAFAGESFVVFPLALQG